MAIGQIGCTKVGLNHRQRYKRAANADFSFQVPPVKCIKSYAAIFTLAGLSIAHDLIIMIMPLPILWELHLPWQKKANLFVMFCIGSFVIVCSLIRLPSLRVLEGSSDPSCKHVQHTISRYRNTHTNPIKMTRHP